MKYSLARSKNKDDKVEDEVQYKVEYEVLIIRSARSIQISSPIWKETDNQNWQVPSDSTFAREKPSKFYRTNKQYSIKDEIKKKIMKEAEQTIYFTSRIISAITLYESRILHH